MTEIASWQYDELKQVGVDYTNVAEVEAYDERHNQFRDVEGENAAIIQALSIQPDDVLIDLGTGTGAFAIQVARRCKKVYAVDVSKVMLEYGSRKAARSGVTNVEFVHGGFLTYSHRAAPVDAVVTSTAFHHLPDFWKAVGLRRMNQMLKTGGKLYLADVVFSGDGFERDIAGWIEEMGHVGGPELQEEMALHLREEYSTFDWILEGLIARANFRIEYKESHGGVLATYLCVKEPDCTL